MEIISIDEAAKMLSLSVGSLRRMRLEDRGPKSFLEGGKVAYYREDVEAWRVEQREFTSRGGVRRTVRTFEDGYIE